MRQRAKHFGGVHAGGAPGRPRCCATDDAGAAPEGGAGGKGAGSSARELDGRSLLFSGSPAEGIQSGEVPSSPQAWYSHSHASYLCSMRHQHGDNLEVRIPAERRPLESLVCAPGLGSLYWIGPDGTRCKHYSLTRSTIDTRCTRARNDARAHLQLRRQVGDNRRHLQLTGKSQCQLSGDEQLARARFPCRY